MKRMTCKELGGACDQEFVAETFEDMAKLSRNHGADMLKQGDMAHYKAMQKIKALMDKPALIKQWMEDTKKAFDAAPEV